MTATNSSRARLSRDIKQAASQRGLSMAALARNAGISDKTLARYLNGSTQDMHPLTKARLEKALGWPIGEIDRRTNPTSYPPPPAREEASYRETEHGTLSWVERDDGRRDYRLVRTIHGKERGVTLSNVALTPEEALEDLHTGLAILEAAYRLEKPVNPER